LLNYDTFTIKDTLGRAVELYVLEVDPQNNGIVGPGTVTIAMAIHGAVKVGE
jgi:hypothetical protein